MKRTTVQNGVSNPFLGKPKIHVASYVPKLYHMNSIIIYIVVLVNFPVLMLFLLSFEFGFHIRQLPTYNKVDTIITDNYP